MTSDHPSVRPPTQARTPKPHPARRRGWWLALTLLLLLAGLSWYGSSLQQPHPERFARGVILSGPAWEAARQTPLAVAYLKDFKTQEHGASCGPASLRNVLASLGHPLARERALFQGERAAWWRMRLMGMTLDELAALAERAGVGPVRVWRDLTEQELRALLESVNTPGRRLIANLDRAPIHGVSLGHFSPIGGYDPASDRVLLLDVTPGYGAQLIPTGLLAAAIDTRDPVSGRARGLLQIDVVRAPQPDATRP